MKVRFIKIITSISLVLGLLGPQVASGYQAKVDQSKVNGSSTQLIVTSSTPPQEIITQTSVLSDCGPLNSFLDRMDILIWQACGNVSVTDEFDLPTLAVIDSPLFVPAVAVEINEPTWVAEGTLNQVENSSETGLIPVNLAASNISKTEVVPYSTTSVNLALSYIENSQNSFTTVSMRC